jgi:predicted ATPase/DNA-binding SARP family transcriptional activator
MGRLALHLLGAFEATVDEKTLAGFKTEKARALLIYLATERSRAHRRQSLVGLLWPDYPEKYARANLRQVLTNLRQVLGDNENPMPFILVEGETIQFNPESDFRLDVVDFERLAAVNDVADLESALALYRGSFLDGFSLKDSPEFDHWTAVLRERYQRMASVVLGRLGEHCEHSQDYEKALGYARKRLELEPWQEAAHRQLMKLLALNGKRPEALAQYETCRKALKSELGIEPSAETVKLYESIRDSQLPEPWPTKAHPNNLPTQLSRFIGRQQECNQVKGLLSHNRLVTLIGPGGVGKTRVAIKVAEEVLTEYTYGVWYVELAPIADPDLVPQTVSTALGLRIDQGSTIIDLLLQYLKKKNILILLDNCEHLVEPCAVLVNHLVQACSELKFIVSSREALGVPGEAVYRMPSMTLPDIQKQQNKESLMQCEAVELFLDRACGVMPGFEITDSNASVIAQICRRLDGIPLALELAAVRLDMLTPEQLFHRLDHVFRLLSGGARMALPRQQTLRATIDWSYQLLLEQERLLLLRLSVFAGGCTLEGMETICSGNGFDEDEIFELLVSLVNKSLVGVDQSQSQEARYWLLETVRQYAREKLYDSGESASLRDRHLAYCVQFAETGYRMLMTDKRLVWTKRLTMELDNLRAAVDWAYMGGENFESGLRIAAALGFRFMLFQGYLEEAARWIRTGLAAVDSAKIAGLLRVRALIALEWLFRFSHGFTEEGSALLEEAIQLCRNIGSQAKPERVIALGALANYKSGLYDAVPLWDEALEIAPDLDREYIWIHANLLNEIATKELSLGNLNAACQYAEAELRLFGPEGCTDRWSSAFAYNILANCESFQGKKSESRVHRLKALALHQESGDNVGFASAYCGLAIQLIRQREFEIAVYPNDQAMRTWHLVGNERLAACHITFLGIILANIGSQLEGQKGKQCFDQAVALLSIADAKYPPDDELLGYYQVTNRTEAEHILHSHLSSDDYAIAWAEGQSMTLEEGIALASKIAEEWNIQA